MITLVQNARGSDHSPIHVKRALQNFFSTPQVMKVGYVFGVKVMTHKFSIGVNEDEMSMITFFLIFYSFLLIAR